MRADNWELAVHCNEAMPGISPKEFLVGCVMFNVAGFAIAMGFEIAQRRAFQYQEQLHAQAKQQARADSVLCVAQLFMRVNVCARASTCR